MLSLGREGIGPFLIPGERRNFYGGLRFDFTVKDRSGETLVENGFFIPARRQPRVTATHLYQIASSTAEASSNDS